MNKKFTHESLEEILLQLLSSTDITQDEELILTQTLDKVTEAEFLPKILLDLKTALTPLAVSQSLSAPVVELFTEISRQQPAGGSAGLFNGFLQD